jgi:hypothetical protein
MLPLCLLLEEKKEEKVMPRRFFRRKSLAHGRLLAQDRAHFRGRD